MLQDQIKVGCSVNNLKTVRQFLRSFLNHLGLSDIDRDMMILAVDEVCSNTMIHGNANNQDHTIEIKVKSDQKLFEIEVLDRGNKFNPESKSDNQIKDLIENQQKGGMGLMLVKRIMDQIQYDTSNGINSFKMVKFL